MSSLIPLEPSRNNYTVIVPIAGLNYQFSNIHWNFEDEAWYFDLLEEDGTPIIGGLKAVLGVSLGRRSTHQFFQDNMLTAVADSREDARFDDFGKRVQLVVTTFADEFNG